MGESLNPSERNVRGKLGLKPLHWAQMPCDIGLGVSSFSFLYPVKIEFAPTPISI